IFGTILPLRLALFLCDRHPYAENASSFVEEEAQFSLLGFLDVDVAMDAAGFFFGADNTTLKVTFGSNFCSWPQNRVFQNRSRSNSTISPDGCAATQLRARVDNRRFVDGHSPVAVVYV